MLRVMTVSGKFDYVKADRVKELIASGYIIAIC